MTDLSSDNTDPDFLVLRQPLSVELSSEIPKRFLLSIELSTVRKTRNGFFPEIRNGRFVESSGGRLACFAVHDRRGVADQDGMSDADDIRDPEKKKTVV